MRTIAHMGRPIKCLDCGRVTRPNLPGIRGTSFGRKALGFIVQLSGMKNVDADIARVFEEMFGFETAATTVWNARKAAADMLEPTMRHIMEELKRAPFLGMDGTHYPINGKRGYVWVVRTPTAACILALPTRSGAVLPTYFKEILDRKVVADGYTVYATHFKILQRCWAHILQDAGKAYLRSRRGSRRAYRALYRRLLGIFHDAKRIAGETADSGGAGADVCLAMERRVMELVALYGSHKFGTTLANAAPHLFAFLWNAAQQQRDGAGHTRRGRPAAQDPPQVRQRRGQEGLLHTAELQHDLPQAGPRPVAVRGEDGGEPRLQHIRRRTWAEGAPVPPDAEREPDRLYVDNVSVENPEGWSAESVKEYLASLYSGSQAEKPSGTAEAGKPRAGEEAADPGTRTVQTGTPAGTERSELVPQILDGPSGIVAKGQGPNPAPRDVHACTGTAFSDAGGIGNAPRRGKPPPIASA